MTEVTYEVTYEVAYEGVSSSVARVRAAASASSPTLLPENLTLGSKIRLKDRMNLCNNYASDTCNVRGVAAVCPVRVRLRPRAGRRQDRWEGPCARTAEVHRAALRTPRREWPPLTPLYCISIKKTDEFKVLSESKPIFSSAT